MKNKRYQPGLRIYILMLLSVAVSLSSCKKFLEEKPSKNLRIVSSLQDAQALLDYYTQLNQSDLAAGEISADDYYLSLEKYNQVEENFQRMYSWEKDHLFAEEFNDWGNLYAAVYRANTALEVSSSVARTSQNAQNWDNVKGQALFFRSWFLLQGLQIWASPYQQSTAASDPGIPLRGSTDFNLPSTRASLKQAYGQLESDLLEASTLLPSSQPGLTRPSKAAGLALRARLYLYKGDYALCQKYAEQALSLHSTLLDYSTLNAQSEYPIAPLNIEILFESYMSAPGLLYNTSAAISQELLSSYAQGDLRRSIFFKANPDGSASFYGSYEGSALFFTGISTAELYLSKAEAAARLGNRQQALKSLDELLSHRWAKDPVTGATLHQPTQASSDQQALEIILQERRKELVMRGMRWADIKRLNLQGAQIALERNIGDRKVTLPASDLRFQLPIPEDVIRSSGIPQNPR